MDTNILITSAGKRVTLVRLFQKELQKSFPDAKVFTTDMKPKLSPAGVVSDGCFQVPRVTSEDYISTLIGICKTHHIKVVVPTIDTELKVLAANREALDEIEVIPLVSSMEFVTACRDKRQTMALFSRLNIRMPELRDINKPEYPIFAKPYDGSLSKDLHIIRSDADITPAISGNHKLMFMEYIDPVEYKEFTVDMYYGKDNRVKCIVPHERLEVRAGEINKGRTCKNYLVSYLKERMDYLPGVIGCICIQLFYREADRDVVGIEINPRFGGGYPLSYYAGANFQGMIIDEYLKGISIDYSEDWRDQTLMLRYDSEVIVHEA